MRRTIPHIAGIVVGVGIIAAVTGLGVGVLLQASPTLTMLLKIAAAGWILWMAWSLWNSDVGKTEATRRPFTFVEATLFQWVNPKIWAVALAANSFVAELSPSEQALALGVTFSTTNLFVCTFWTSIGLALSKLLARPDAWRAFSRMMAALLAIFAILVFL